MTASCLQVPCLLTFLLMEALPCFILGFSWLTGSCCSSCRAVVEVAANGYVNSLLHAATVPNEGGYNYDRLSHCLQIYMWLRWS